MSAVMLLPGTNGSLLLVQRTVTRTIVLQETIGKGSEDKSWLWQGDLSNREKLKRWRQSRECEITFSQCRLGLLKEEDTSGL
ncbi:hypothetical protein STEG23_025008 [Scotinomys teguina]